MSQRRVGKPVTQVPLTNIAVVRLKRGGKRFEIACYKNKVVNWRNGVEKDIDEVLQMDRVFKDVIKGYYASKKDLIKAFKHADEKKICREILDKGKEQVSGKEREVQMKNMFLDIATIVAQICVNPDTNRPYPVKMVERTMRQMHFNPNLNSSAKRQALQCIQHLQKKCPGFIVRAKMKARIAIPSEKADACAKLTSTLRERIKRLGAIEIKETKALSSPSSSSADMYFVFDPKLYREIHKVTRDHGEATLHLLNTSVSAGGDRGESREKKVDTNDAVAANFASMGIKGTVAASIPKSSDATDMIRPIRESVATKVTPSAMAATKMKNCRTCGPGVIEPSKFRAHFKSEWHRYNLKAKQKCIPVLSEKEFGALAKGDKEKFFAS